ncbi:YraN family protein [soil metagenome]
MAQHNNTGRTGENLAVKYLQDNGYFIKETNWRHRHWEVDVIASKNDVLHFIEIKTRRSRKFGFPEEDVNRKKISNLMHASEEYLINYPGWKRIQFDILSINLQQNGPPEYFFIEDVGL